MTPLGRSARIYLGVILAVVLAGFVAEKIFGGKDATGEAREAVEALPYRTSTHPGSDGALLGTVRAHHGVVIHFAISEHGPEPRGIPPRLVRVAQNVTDSGGFWVWDDSEPWFRRGSAAQWQEAARVSVAIEEALCRKETGDPCEI